MRRSSLLLLSAVTGVVGVLVGPTLKAADVSAAEMPIVADLEGVPIDASDAGRYFCHDFEYPLIHCFSSAPRLEEALVNGTMAGTAVMPHAAGHYVTVYSEPSYAGAYAHLSQDYDGLWAIGWNDRIRSFRVLNSASGTFHTDWYSGGRQYHFCCNDAIPYLTDPYDASFSSVYRH